MTNPFINNEPPKMNTLDKIKPQRQLRKNKRTKSEVFKDGVVYLFQQRWFRKFLVFFAVFAFGGMLGSGLFNNGNSNNIEPESSKYSISSDISDEQKIPNLSGFSIAQAEQILNSLEFEYEFSEKIDTPEDWIAMSSAFSNQYSSKLIVEVEKTPERLEKEAEEERIKIEEEKRIEAEKEVQKEQERIQAAEERAKREEAQRIEDENRRIEMENNRANNFAAQPQETPSGNPNAALTATCNDGSHSESEPGARDYRGMCSGHGGISIKHGR